MQRFLESLLKNSSLGSRYFSVCRETLGLQGEPSALAPLLSDVGNENVILYQIRLLTWRRAEKRKERHCVCESTVQMGCCLDSDTDEYTILCISMH